MKDLEFMRRQGWNLDKSDMIQLSRFPGDRKRIDINGRIIEDNNVRAQVYRYRDPNFSIRHLPIIEEEEPWLDEFRFLAEYFKDKPDFQSLRSLALRIEDLRCENLNVIVPDMRQEIYLQGFNHFDSLYQAIQLRCVLKINYTTYNGTSLEWIISPYFLKEYNNRWFLFGFNHNEDVRKLTNVALDRIDRIEKVDEEYIKHEEVEQLKNIQDFDDYFEDIIGVTIPKDGNICEITLKFTDRRYPNVVTKPIHPSQKNYDTEKTVKISVIPNPELYQTLLSFGSDVVVLEPEHVRCKLADIIADMWEKYKID